MIIFYNKLTGKIVGTIEGRLHSEDHLKMWIGSKDEIDRVVCQWKKTFDEWLPDLQNKEQSTIFVSLDKKEAHLGEYIIDITTKKLKLK